MSTVAEQKSSLITGGVPIVKLAPRYIQLGDPSAGKFNVELARDTHSVVREKHGYHPYLRVSIGNDGVIRGSNPFILTEYGQEAEKLHGPGLRRIDYETLKNIVEQSRGDDSLRKLLSTFCDDAGLVASERKGPNEQYRQHLLSQLRERGIQLPFPILFDRLKLEKDGNFPSGLRFDLADEESVAHHDPNVPQYGGLRRLYRYWDLVLNADFVSLPYSYMAGRVSFVKVVAPQNLEAAVAEIEALNRRYTAEKQ